VGEWKLGKNKTEINEDADRLEDLFNAVEQTCLPVLKRAESLGSKLQSQAFEGQIADILNASIADAKATRSKGNKHGTKKPRDTGRKHRQSEKPQTGNSFPRHGSAMKVVHASLGGEVGIGQVKPPTIIMNLDHPWVAGARRDQNIMAGTILAASLISAEHVFAPNGKLKLRGLVDEADQTNGFSHALGTVLSGDLAVDGTIPIRLVGAK
jgi:hypothetical protein